MINLTTMKKIVLITCFISFSISSQAFSLKIDKMRIYETVKPGDVIQGVINVMNDSKSPQQISTLVEDIDFKHSEQLIDFKTLGSQTDSCARWISFMPKDMEIPPVSMKAVQYIISVPKDVTLAEYYAVIYIESAASTPTDLSATILASSKARMAVLVKITLSGLAAPQGTVEKISVVPAKDDKPMEITYDFDNTGNVLQKVNGSFSIIDAEGNLYGRGTLNQGVAKGGNKISIITTWDGELRPGEYDLVAEFKYDPKQTEIREAHFTIE
ncbi:MAG: hypothetical protein JW774_10270 [Candidatus Aureabacteria bacterium]|nr:hypothetical protein [Candidatus Auribacterota bacterium]